MEKILIIDDDRDMQLVLSDVVRSGGYEAIVAGNGRQALKELSAQSPDLVLLDLKLPGMNGMSVLEEIKKIDKNLIVIMLTGYGDIKGAVKAMKLGAFDYITKPFDNDVIIENINNALNTRRRGVNNIITAISLREKEVLAWLKKGKSSWDIAIILGISERTVNYHVKNIMHKLNAVSRTQAVALAMEHGLIE